MSKSLEEIEKNAQKIQRVFMPDELRNKLLEIPVTIQSDIKNLNPRVKWLLVAGIAAMIALNVFVSLHYGSSKTSNNGLGETYFSYLKQL